MRWIVAVVLCLVYAVVEAGRPNVVLILADDLGFSDLGCYGGEIRTPNIDRLAEGGVRFTQFYNCARCCPSRVSLLSGLYPHQVGVGLMTGADRGVPGYRGAMQGNCVTIAEALRAAGYRTLMSGKWHVGDPPLPTERGFDEFYGFVRGYGVDCWAETPAKRGPGRDVFVRLPDGRPRRHYESGRFYATDAITDYALEFVEQARQEKDRPWFLYLAYNAPHFPLQAPPEVVENYVQIYERGWDVIRAERLAAMKKLGIVAEDQGLSPRAIVPAEPRKFAGEWAGKANPAWDSLPEDRRHDLARRMAIYAAMVEVMDRNIGRVIEDLDKHGELTNTMIMFLSDNGACAEWNPYGFDGSSGPDNVLHRGEELKKMGGPGTFHSYGSGWANACNTPLRLYKHFAHEGGISTPLIVRWPAGLSRAGVIEREAVGHLIDVMPTLLEVCGAKKPDVGGVLPLEGVSLLGVLKGEVLEREQPLCWEHEGNRAIRVGDWKLVSAGEGRWELYDVVHDRAELRDRAAEFPERVREMSEKWERWAERCYVVPRGETGKAKK